jgi:hypothetical protein
VKRPTIALTLAALMIFGVAGCGDDEKADDTTELESDGSKASDTTEADSNDSSSSDSSSDEPDLSDLGDMDLGNLDECMTVAATYAGLAMSALGGEEAAKEALSQLDELKTELPSDLEDDLDVIAEAYGEVADKGIIDGADALDSDEFNEADANIQAWLEETCGG